MSLRLSFSHNQKKSEPGSHTYVHTYIHITVLFIILLFFNFKYAVELFIGVGVIFYFLQQAYKTLVIARLKCWVTYATVLQDCHTFITFLLLLLLFIPSLHSSHTFPMYVLLTLIPYLTITHSLLQVIAAALSTGHHSHTFFRLLLPHFLHVIFATRSSPSLEILKSGDDCCHIYTIITVESDNVMP